MPSLPSSRRAQEMGIPVAPQVKARLGKAAKGLLDCGFDPKTRSLRQRPCWRSSPGWFGSMETIAQEFVVAAAGHAPVPERVPRALGEVNAQLAHSDSVVWQTMRAEMARREEMTP